MSCLRVTAPPSTAASVTVTIISVTDNGVKIIAYMEMTIDQLAQRVSMTSRNIREWQRQGLLPPPTRRGRVGIYSDEHVARIRRVQQLHSEGFPLDLIRRMIDAGTGNENDIRHLAAEVLAPFSTAGPTTVSRSELDNRLGTGAAAHLAKLGLIADADGDPVSVRDAETLDLIEGLTGVGVSLERLVATLVDVRSHQRSIADGILRAYAEDVWEPFVSSRFATPDWGSLADNASRGRRLAIALLTHMQHAAFDDAAASVMLSEVGQAERALDGIKPTRERS
jgi:DNA-binding transcriptional MerR regulator